MAPWDFPVALMCRKLKFELFSLFRQTGFGCLSYVVVTKIFSLKLSELIYNFIFRMNSIKLLFWMVYISYYVVCVRGNRMSYVKICHRFVHFVFLIVL